MENVERTESAGNIKAKRIIYYILGILEILFAFRLVLKVLGANPGSPFVSIIYSITNLFLAPFYGIFRIAVSEGIETQSVLEPALIIAMLAYAALAWSIAKLVDIMSNNKEAKVS
ncbi:hypothetical protein [Gudongella sp. DL1XJH-153]|uniref:hypothetical protein n=1 Tax=Gudongella sp. DL1XJH-153 TaxID=3409804 RepID=UPI003BB7E48C